MAVDHIVLRVIACGKEADTTTTREIDTNTNDPIAAGISVTMIGAQGQHGARQCAWSRSLLTLCSGIDRDPQRTSLNFASTRAPCAAPIGAEGRATPQKPP